MLSSRYVRILNNTYELKEYSDNKKVAVDVDSGKEMEWGIDNEGFFLKTHNKKTKMDVVMYFNGTSQESLNSKRALVEFLLNGLIKMNFGVYPSSTELEMMYTNYLKEQIFVKSLHGKESEYSNYIAHDEVYYFRELVDETFIKTRYIDFYTFESLNDLMIRFKKYDFVKINENEAINLKHLNAIENDVITLKDGLTDLLKLEQLYSLSFKKKLRKSQNELHN